MRDGVGAPGVARAGEEVGTSGDAGTPGVPNAEEAKGIGVAVGGSIAAVVA